MREIVTLAAAATWRTPVIAWQGLRAKRSVVRLPQAEGDFGTVGDASDPSCLRLVVLGDSLAGGVGVEHHLDTLAGGVATRLAAREERPVQWVVAARTGFTAAQVMTLIDDAVLAQADVVVVSVGANDAKNMHTARRWRDELTALLNAVCAASERAEIVLLPVPMLQMCPALPGALAQTLGTRAAQFDAIADDVVAGSGRVRRIMRFEPSGDGLFAADGFHPSAAFHAIYAEQIDAALTASDGDAPTRR
ncbi:MULTISPECIES: SGNH/GDSL hydrolase family protein [Gordonia]|uniref:SGNH/GDSL hydrolase family protein n=1 Tax=Gordonia TaxID=2053 RepID=UPI001E2C4C98|nr:MULTISPECIES: SGNH/GDSL hydrolase family protein [Gordonia]